MSGSTRWGALPSREFVVVVSEHMLMDADWFAISIDALPGPCTIRVVANPKALRGSRLIFSTILRERKTTAYVWEAYQGGLYAWVARTVTPASVQAQGLHVLEIRRTAQAKASVLLDDDDDDEKEGRGSYPASSNERAYKDRWRYTADMYALPRQRDLRLEDPPRIFDTQKLLDLPPPGWPATGTNVECRKNILPDLKPTLARSWSGHVWHLRKIDAAEERHANRVLENERAVESATYKKREREAQALVDSLITQVEEL